MEECHGWYRDAVEKELAAPSPLRLEAARYPDNRQMFFEVHVTNRSTGAFGPADLYCAVYERAQRGRTHRYLWHLSRTMTIDQLAPRESQMLTYASPSLPLEVDLSLVEGLAFVQQSNGNEIYQAAYANIPSMFFRPSALNVMLTPESGVSGPQGIIVDGVGLPFEWTIEVPGEEWLQANPRTGARGEAFQVTVDPTVLSYGTYTAAIVVRADAPVTPAECTLPVTLYVVPHVEKTFLPLVSSF